MLDVPNINMGDEKRSQPSIEEKNNSFFNKEEKKLMILFFFSARQ